jgi:two-component system chemotaxis sensor kinase CheA
MPVASALPGQIVDRFRVVAVERLERIEVAWNALMTNPEAATITRMHREVHTLKGEARIVGFNDVDLVCHRLEDLLVMARQRAYAVSEEFDLAVTMALHFMTNLVRQRPGAAPVDLPGFLAHIDAVVDETQRERPVGVPQLPSKVRENETLDALPLIRARLGSAALAVFLELHGRAAGPRMEEAWRSMRDVFAPPDPVSVRALMERHEVGAIDLARSLGKQVEIRLELAELSASPAIVNALDVAIVHLLRNAIDHGAESPEARERVGKPPAATITVTCWADDHQMHLAVSDDGRGIDHAAIHQRAIALGLAAPGDEPTREELEALLFHPAFSTRTVLTAVSGRGIGLDAVKSAVSFVGGTVTIESTLGEGTTFSVAVPGPVRRVRVRRLAVPNLRIPIAVSADWVVVREQRCADADVIDLAMALDLGATLAPVGDPLCLQRRHEKIYLRAGDPDEVVEVDRLVITPADAVAEIASFDGVEGLVIRPERLRT